MNVTSRHRYDNSKCKRYLLHPMVFKSEPFSHTTTEQPNITGGGVAGVGHLFGVRVKKFNNVFCELPLEYILFYLEQKWTIMLVYT